MESGAQFKLPQKPTSKKGKKKSAAPSKEQLDFILQRKKECNVKAQKIVEELIEPSTTEKADELKEKLKYISPSHFEDIIEERAITKLCGYPLCGKELTDIPAQQYHISLAQKKIYDITERKSFCSGQCFKSANYLKVQLLTSPLWSRREDDVIPDFKLLDLK